MNVVITGLADNDPLPKNPIEVVFGAGGTTRAEGLYAILLVGGMLASGVAVPGVVYGPLSNPRLVSEADAALLFGAGSELALMLRAVWLINRNTPVYAIATGPIDRGAPATFDIAFSGKAKIAGRMRVFVGADFVDVGILKDDDGPKAALAAAARVNEKADWPVTASVVDSVTLRLTARQPGERGNWLRGGQFVQGADGLVATNAAQGFFGGGAGLDDLEPILTTLRPLRFYYTAVAATDAAQLRAFAGHIDAQASPDVGLRQRLFAGSVDTIAKTVPTTTAINAARSELYHLAECDWTPAMMAAHFAAIVAKYEAGFPFRTNFAGFGQSAETRADLRIPAPRSGAAPSVPELTSALLNGVSPIGVNPNGSTFLVNRITTRSLSGSTPDYSIRDAHKVTIADRYADDLGAKYDRLFRGKTIGDDPPRGRKPPGPLVVTASRLKAAVDRLTREYGDADLLQNTDAIIEGTIVARPSTPRTRLGVLVPLETIDNLYQIASRVEQVG